VQLSETNKKINAVQPYRRSKNSPALSGAGPKPCLCFEQLLQLLMKRAERLHLFVLVDELQEARAGYTQRIGVDLVLLLYYIILYYI